jgi:hypothetical protein
MVGERKVGMNVGVSVSGDRDGDEVGNELGGSVTVMTVLFKTYLQMVEPMMLEGTSQGMH